MCPERARQGGGAVVALPSVCLRPRTGEAPREKCDAADAGVIRGRSDRDRPALTLDDNGTAKHTITPQCRSMLYEEARRGSRAIVH